MEKAEISIRRKILSLVCDYAALKYADTPFIPGETSIPPAGKQLGAPELQNMVEASLDGWLTMGRFNDLFEDRFAGWIGAPHCLTVNSGSSANLLAVTALTSPLLKDKRLLPGDEVITTAAGFPTTVNPIIQNGLTPVFVDIKTPSFNVDAAELENAITSKTKALFFAHTLGNPFDIDLVSSIAKKYGLWLIEDCCDALGSEYRGKKVGTFGDMATFSFYPAHHITMGEGGAIVTNSRLLNKIIMSLRDWGRDCSCPPGEDNSCGKRFSQKHGDLPFGYDHKYVYSHSGYNLKITDIQAACGLAQMDRLDGPEGFIQMRRNNYELLLKSLQHLKDSLIFMEPTPEARPSWFGFLMSIREDSVKRVDLLRYLDSRKIGSRLLFGGNLVRQPYFKGITHRVHGHLTVTDAVTKNAFWVGLHPSLTLEQLKYVIKSLGNFFSR